MKKRLVVIATMAMAGCGGSGDVSLATQVHHTGTGATRLQAAMVASVDGFDGQVSRLYQAAFDRQPDPTGHASWVGLMQKGMTLDQVALGFVDSDEFTQRYGSGLTTAQYITQLYANVLHRQPDPAGYEFWNTLINNGTYRRNQVLVMFSESPENKYNTSTGWKTTGSLSLPYVGTVLGTATIRRPDGTSMIIVSGPTYEPTPRWHFTCKPSPFLAVGVTASGELTNKTAALNTASTAIHSREMTVADFNNDGVDDTFSGNSGCDNWQELHTSIGERSNIFLSSGSQIVDGSAALASYGSYAHSVSAAITGYSSNVDVLVGAMGGDILYPFFLRGDGKGGFTRDSTALADNLERFTSSLLADVNGDGKADLIIGTQENSAVAGSVYLNDGKGRFTGSAIPLPVGINGAKNNLVMDIVATDLNGDGKTDLLLSTTQNTPVYYGNGKVQVLIGSGDGRFTDKTNSYFPSYNSNVGWIQFLHLVDLDGDGIQDLLLQADNPRDTDVLAYRYTGAVFEAISRDMLPASVKTLIPIRAQEKLTLVSMYDENGILQAKAYQFKKGL